MFSRLCKGSSSPSSRQYDSGSLDPSLLLEYLAFGGGSLKSNFGMTEKFTMNASIRIVLNKKDARVGEPVSGQVLFQTQEPLEFVGVHLNLHGFVRKQFGVSFSQKKGQNSHTLIREVQSPKNMFNSHLNMFSNTNMKAENSSFIWSNMKCFSTRRKLNDNFMYVLPFELDFPEFLPHSGSYKLKGIICDEFDGGIHEITHINVDYYLTATLINERNSMMISHSQLCPITLLKNKKTQLPKPEKSQIQIFSFKSELPKIEDNRFFAKLLCFCQASPFISADFSFNEPQKTLEIHFSWLRVMRSSDDVKVTIGLIENIDFSYKTKMNRNTIWKTIFHIGDKEKGSSHFSIPKDEIEPLPDLDINVVQISHSIKVKIQADEVKEVFSGPIEIPKFYHQKPKQKEHKHESLFSIVSDRNIPNAFVNLPQARLKITKPW